MCENNRHELYSNLGLGRSGEEWGEVGRWGGGGGGGFLIKCYRSVVSHTHRLTQHRLSAMTQSKVSEIITFASDIEGFCIFSFLDLDSDSGLTERVKRLSNS